MQFELAYAANHFATFKKSDFSIFNIYTIENVKSRESLQFKNGKELQYKYLYPPTETTLTMRSDNFKPNHIIY